MEGVRTLSTHRTARAAEREAEHIRRWQGMLTIDGRHYVGPDRFVLPGEHVVVAAAGVRLWPLLVWSRYEVLALA